MLPLLFLLFIVVPLVELYVIIQIGQAIGALPTIGLLVLDSILGAALARSQGRAVWRQFRDALAAGRPPAREVLDGTLVIFGGALLLAPGFLTDVVGIVLLLPPTRALVRRGLVRNLQSRLLLSFARGGRPPRNPPGPPPGATQPYDVDSTAQDVDPRHLPG